MKQLSRKLKATLAVMAILLLIGCNSVKMPELSMPDFGLPEMSMPDLGLESGSKTKPSLPISVSYAFDTTVTQAMLELNACGAPYTINTGEIIPQAFLAIGQKQFKSVAAYSGSGQTVQASQQTDLTVYLQLINQSFESTKMAEEDTFLAYIALQMLATFIDSSGNKLAQTPLNYRETASFWTPTLTNSSVSCVTTRYDNEINRAAEDLARQLVSVVPQVLEKPVAAEPSRTQPTQPRPKQVHQQTLPSMKFRTMLRDGNNNLILESGEILALQIEATNSSNQSLPEVTIELEGHPTLIQAFSEMTPLPISFGDFRAGETKTTEMRGRMPSNVSQKSGELIVTLKPRGGSIIGSHRILAVLQSSPSTGSQDSSTQIFSRPNRENSAPSKNKYVAILIGMDQYRDNWRQSYRIQKGQIKSLKNALETTGLFSKQYIRLLRGSHATRTDIEEALLSWGRQRLEKDSILIFHFSGQALSHPATGEIYLVPFEGSPSASAKRLISLRTLQRVLGKLNNRLTLLILDTPVTPLLAQSKAVNTKRSTQIKWTSGLARSQQQRTKVIQIRKNSPDNTDGPTELFAGLLGQADTDENGIVTLGEFLHDLSAISKITSAPSRDSSEYALPLAQ